MVVEPKTTAAGQVKSTHCDFACSRGPDLDARGTVGIFGTKNLDASVMGADQRQTHWAPDRYLIDQFEALENLHVVPHEECKHSFCKCVTAFSAV